MRVSTVVSGVVFVVRYELAMWHSLLRWISRRPVVATGSRAFPYAAVMTPVLFAFIGVSAVELPVLHLLLPWETVRFIADLIGVYGLLWMFGLLASVRVHPHVVDDDGVRLRNGALTQIVIPWDAIEAVRSRHRPVEDKRAWRSEGDGRGIGTLHILNQTNVDIVLRAPTLLSWKKLGGEPVSEFRCYADDPDRFVTAMREQLATRTTDEDHAAPRG